MNERYEYMRETVAGVPTLHDLNNFGEDRWELCGVFMVYGRFELIFKRSINPITESLRAVETTPAQF